MLEGAHIIQMINKRQMSNFFCFFRGLISCKTEQSRQTGTKTIGNIRNDKAAKSKNNWMD